MAPLAIIVSSVQSDTEGFRPGTRISTSPSSSPSLLSFWSSPSSSKGDAPARDRRKVLYRSAPRSGYPRDSFMMASSSSSDESFMPDPPDGPTISPMSSSSSSSTSRGARPLPRARAESSSPSSEEFEDKESGGLNPDSAKGGEENGASLDRSVEGNAAPAGELCPSASSSNPAMTKGLVCHWTSVPWGFECSETRSLSSPSCSPFSAACAFCFANRAASWRRARDGPRLRGAGGGGRIGIGWLVEFVDAYGDVRSATIQSFAYMLAVDTLCNADKNTSQLERKTI
ncbi:uncharacterized protein BDW47DRAFT_68301 [Aspergillus candidus]|uniref:Uncharacterized protein n=1 Tax=Aspergillus candidus TaxID=41067 RepID=A0A2I2F389_ASPCN|nr:hypothetical protein BDW47DRAFT_68301 [Aspergillus candidus]PLB35094.1 hypothetical protein BDW47DRAFT_68301 [Aspergillus candidus]